MTTSFKTNPESLKNLMTACGEGRLQLPDFQRGWVWDQDRIVDLLASISEGFPIGALMALDASGEVSFATRPVEGANPHSPKLESYLLDGQQRMTSLYQATATPTPVQTRTAKGKDTLLHFYFDVRKCLDSTTSRRDAVISVPADKIVRTNFNRDVTLDLSTRERELEHLYFPIDEIFDANRWQQALWQWINGDIAARGGHMTVFGEFWERIVSTFNDYQVPVITLGKDTSRAAVCLVFEKVNTGGKALDAFELVTAMYAASGFHLRDDWARRSTALSQHPVLRNVEPVEFLQAVSLLHTKAERARAVAQEREAPAISATRQSLLQLPLEAYQAYADRVQAGYVAASKFLHGQRLFRAVDLPYQGQLVPLAAVLTELGSRWENATVKAQVARWFWCGVFGELYGSATESRFALDIAGVPAWIDGGSEPRTVEEASFEERRLRSMRTRLSGAYKGVHALLMRSGAKDFLSGEPFDQAVFFDENVDIHHIFPRKWCEDRGIDAAVFNSIINKTPLASRTNRILGGVAPSLYLDRLSKGGGGSPALNDDALTSILRSHEIDPELLQADDFGRFFDDRRERLLRLIEDAMGQTVVREAQAPAERDEPENEAEARAARDEERVDA